LPIPIPIPIPLLKCTANINTNAFMAILLTVLLHSVINFFNGHLLIKSLHRLLSEHGKITAVYNDEHCHDIQFRCKTTVRVFTLSGTAALSLTE